MRASQSRSRPRTNFDNCGVYNNTASFTATNHPNGSDPGQVTCEKPNLTITKTPDGQTINAGEDVVFDITVANSNADGTGTAKDVVLTDPLPQGVAGDWELVAPVPAGCTIDTTDPQPDDLSCTQRNLGKGESLTVKVKAPTNFDNCGVYNNTASFTATNHPNGSNPGQVTCEKPDLGVLKVAVNATINAGEDAVFNITVTNTGPGTAKDVKLTDTLPGPVAGDWVLSGPDATDCQPFTSPNLDCFFGNLASDESRTVTLTAPTDFEQCSELNNTATATATNAPNDSDSATINCEKPNLTVNKTPDSQTISAGDDVVFTMEVSNTGPGTAKGVTLSDTLPTGVVGNTWVEDPDNPQCEITGGNQLDCDFGDLTSGASKTVTVRAATDFDNCGVYDNTATASAENAGAPVNDDGQVTCQKPSLRVEKTGNGPIDAGEDVVFTINVTNDGPGVAKSVSLQDSLPTGTAGPWAITTQPGGNPCSISGTNLSCDFGDLGANETVTVRVAAATSIQRCGQYDNTATAVAENAPEVEDDASVRCDTPPNLTLNKKANKKKVNPGGRVKYTITVKNTRKDTVAKNVKVCDRIPRLMTVVNRGGGFFQNGKLCWKISKLPFSKQGKSFRYVTRVSRNAKPGTKLRNVVTLGKLKDKKTVKVKPKPRPKPKPTPVTG